MVVWMGGFEEWVDGWARGEYRFMKIMEYNKKTRKQFFEVK
jgi:hypothetical protein